VLPKSCGHVPNETCGDVVVETSEVANKVEKLVN